MNINLKFDNEKIYKECIKLGEEENFDKLIPILNNLIKDENFNENWPIKFLGIAYYKLSKFDYAEYLLKQFVEKEPNDYQGIVSLCFITIATKKYHDCVKFALRAIKLDKNNPTAYIDLAVAYEKLNEHEKNLTLLQKAYKIFPDVPIVVNNLIAAYFTLGYDEEATSLAEELYKKKPNYHALLYNLGSIYLQNKQLDKSLKILLKNSKIEKYKFFSMFLTSHVYFYKNNFKLFRQFYQFRLDSANHQTNPLKYLKVTEY